MGLTEIEKMQDVIDEPRDLDRELEEYEEAMGEAMDAMDAIDAEIKAIEADLCEYDAQLATLEPGATCLRARLATLKSERDAAARVLDAR